MRYKLSIPVTISLIVLTILVITAFQVYWLNKNYREEEKLFSTRTNILFRETLFHLQASKLKLDSGFHITVDERQGVTRITNVLQERFRDSAVLVQPAKRAVFMAVRATPASRDSFNAAYGDTNRVQRVRVMDVLAGVDSLRDSITVKEVAHLYSQALSREKINLPFSIHTVPVDTHALRGETMPFPNDFDGNTVTIGFTKPVSYQLLFGNHTWYLLQRISQPILISALLLGITILSFLLLYRNLKQQRKLAQLKNDFISNITHELKTPIATVSVAIEALRSFNVLEDRETTNEYLEISANEMQRLSLLVDKVLKLSMFENREITLSKEQFDLRTLAASVMDSMRLQFEKHRAHTSIKTSGHNFIITADKLHITSVLYNLLDNALKYSVKDPEIFVHILDHGQYLEMRVTDNGMGIANEYKGKIFEKFFRIPNGNRHNIKGYGLGLSYVSHIVQRHMGFIEVESELNKGSTFSVKLPFVEAPVIYYDKNRQVRSKIF